MRGLTIFQLDYYGRQMRAFAEVLALLLVVMVMALLFALPAQAQGTGTLTISTVPAPTPGQVINTITWTSSPSNGTCVASGDWSGNKAASGSETLPASTPPNSYAMRCTSPGDTSAALTWIAPTTNNDGTALAKCAAATDTGPCLAKYRIVRAATAAAVASCVAGSSSCEIREHPFPNATSAGWTGLSAGTHFFALRAVTGSGVESILSNAVSKTTGAGTEWNASVGVKVPSPPTGVTVQ